MQCKVEIILKITHQSGDLLAQIPVLTLQGEVPDSHGVDRCGIRVLKLQRTLN